MTSEFIFALGKANLAAAAAIVAVILLRKPVRTMFGARLGYLIWLAVPAAAAAVLIPARTLVRNVAVSAGVGTPVTMDFVASAPAAWDPWPVVAAIWVAGAIGMAAWLIRKQLAFLADERRGRAGPAVVGVLNPRIVTPANFAQVFDAGERTVILEHEAIHIARRDAGTNGLVALAQCVCWFNPLVHAAAYLMRIDQEMACDAQVIERHPKARRTYAEAMVKAELAGRALPLGCYWPQGADHPLTTRVAMLKRAAPGRVRRMTGLAGLIVLSAGAGLGAWASQPDRIEYRPVISAAPPSPEQELADRGVAQDPAGIAGAMAAAKEAEKPQQETQTREVKPSRPAQDQPAPQPQQQVQPQQSPVIRDIIIEGNNRIEASAIRSKLLLKPGDRLDNSLVQGSMRALFVTGLFADVKILQRDGDLVVKVIERAVEPQPTSPPPQGALAIPGVPLQREIRDARFTGLDGNGQPYTLTAERVWRSGNAGAIEFIKPLMVTGPSTISAEKAVLDEGERIIAFKDGLIRQNSSGDVRYFVQMPVMLALKAQ
ncbi:MAG TPA: M56 family metallopeptidase [Hyphomonadaceae bacterium]|jgi:beta-lactamase regulating signal transducer with metallopeptidase domain|nr:M56 family metallopeptidase [Hyphomonadaceae bacterium]